SCPEVNLNPGLTVRAECPEAIATALQDVLSRRMPVLCGGPLRQALDTMLARCSNPNALA
ncbi:MAG: hypothetical protein ACRYG8_41435, partial [Janthinobacterium lividum]